MLKTHCIPFLKAEHILRKTFFQQDGAPPHIAKAVKSFLLERFPGGLISRHFPFRWPPRSPDLNPLDFWFWGDLKRIVFNSPVDYLDDLRERIVDAVSNVPREMLANVINSIPERMKKLRFAGGAQFA